jgi:hypothetical protein
LFWRLEEGLVEFAIVCIKSWVILMFRVLGIYNFVSLTNIGSGGVEEGVKYYRGQITMTVTSSALTTAAPQHTEVSNNKNPPKIRLQNS